MAASKQHLTGTAGEHFVASQIALLGFIPALVRQGAPSVDILVSTLDGGKTVGIQVKTTEWAVRTRGRGENKVPHELQFPLGHHAIESTDNSSIFCFVDLRIHENGAIPDVYIIPATKLKRHYSGVDIRQFSFFRLHWPISHMKRFKNNWEPVTKALRT